jgi:hypothetical protein
MNSFYHDLLKISSILEENGLAAYADRVSTIGLAAFSDILKTNLINALPKEFHKKVELTIENTLSQYSKEPKPAVFSGIQNAATTLIEYHRLLSDFSGEIKNIETQYEKESREPIKRELEDHKKKLIEDVNNYKSRHDSTLNTVKKWKVEDLKKYNEFISLLKSKVLELKSKGVDIYVEEILGDI